MKISRVFSIAAVMVGVLAMALGTPSPNLAARRARSVSPTVAVAPSFDTCLIDSAGNQLQWNSTTGAYTFTRASDGFMLSGTGVVRLVNGIRTLTDFKPDRRLSAGLNTGQLTGTATIYLMVAQGVWQLLRIIDNNPAAMCTPPPAIASFTAAGPCSSSTPPQVTLTWTTSNATSVSLVYTQATQGGPCSGGCSSGPQALSGSASLDTLFPTVGQVQCNDTVTLTAAGAGGSVSQTINP
jgi:hypothetical protein